MNEKMIETLRQIESLGGRVSALLPKARKLGVDHRSVDALARRGFIDFDASTLENFITDAGHKYLAK